MQVVRLAQMRSSALCPWITEIQRVHALHILFIFASSREARVIATLQYLLDSLYFKGSTILPLF